MLAKSWSVKKKKSLRDLACYEGFLLSDATSALTIRHKENQFKMGI